MQSKTFEIRDRGTFIPALAIRLDPACERDRYLLARAGYGRSADDQSGYVILFRLGEPSESSADPFSWGSNGARTMRIAHGYIFDNFEKLESGAVVDVEFILGESATAKRSEQETVSEGP